MIDATESEIGRAVRSVDRALGKTICDVAPVLRRTYKLTDGELRTAIAFALVSNASAMLAARIYATAESGLDLRQRLHAVMAEWIQEHAGSFTKD